MRPSQKRWLQGQQALEQANPGDLAWDKRKSGKHGPAVMQLVPRVTIRRLDLATTPTQTPHYRSGKRPMGDLGSATIRE